MKKSILITSILGVTLITALGFTQNTFAANVNVTKMPTKTMANSQHRPDALSKFMRRVIRIDISQFLDEDITDEERDELYSSVKDHMEEGKEMLAEIREAKKNGEDISDLVDEYVEHQIEGLDLVDEYIDEDKKDEWEDVKADYEENIRANEEFRTGMMEDRDQIKESHKSIGGNWKDFHSDNGDINDFFKSDLTDDEKEELQELRKEHFENLREIRKEMVEAYRNGDDLDELEDQFAEEQKEALDVLDDYIDEDKLDEWEDYKNDYASVIDENDEHRDQIIAAREDMKDRISDKTERAIENLLERLDRILSSLDEDKLEEVVENISNKIDKIRDRTDSSNMSDEKKEEMNYILDEIEAILDMYR